MSLALGNKGAADWNEWSRVEVVNLMDGWMDGLLVLNIANQLKEAYRGKKKNPLPFCHLLRL